MAKCSVIVTGRNDNYDGDFDNRLTTALSRNISALPNAEFIFVEWNPLLNRPLLCHNLRKIFGERIKYIAVHPRFHEQYCHIDWFIEYPAKNVGIRNATGDFIVCTNSDIVFSPQVIDAMKGKLDKDIFYRAMRIDIPIDYRNIEFPLKREYKLQLNKGVMNGAGDFLLMHKDLWYKMTGYCEAFPEQRLHKDAFIIYLLMEKHKYTYKDIGYVTHWAHASSWNTTACKRPRIGDPYWDFKTCGYEKNKDTWGLTFARREKKDGVLWIL